MRNILLIAATLVFVTCSVFSQDYYRLSSTGTSAPYSLGAGGTKILLSGSEDMLSESIDIPFAFEFYGKPVTSFKASDNGYIVFNADANLTTSTGENVSLPDASAPKNAIFGFWDATQLKTLVVQNQSYASEIRTITLGVAPNRIQVIQWFTASMESAAPSTTNFLYYAIRLHENHPLGKNIFDVVYNYASSALPQASATIGIQNDDGTKALVVSGSPELDFPNKISGSSNETDKVYTFIPGTQKSIEVRLTSPLSMPLINTSDGGEVSVQAVNLGKTKVTKGVMNYQIGSKDVVSSNFSNSIAANYGKTELTAGSNILPEDSDIGKDLEVKVWLSGINGLASTDPGSTSDTLTMYFFVNKGISSTKRPLLEEGSGAWCGYCPDGHLTMRDLLQEHGENLVAVVHHNSDGMVNAGSDEINATFATGYPYGLVDRASSNGEMGLNRGQWATAVSQRLNSPAPVEVKIKNQKFDESTRMITFDVESQFIDFALPGSFRINAFIVEDKVRGPKISATDKKWNQVNYYSKNYSGGGAGGPSHELYNEQPYIFGYYHNHVVRAVLEDTWGTNATNDGSIPQTPVLEKTYTKSFSYKLPNVVNVTYTENPVIKSNLQSTENGPGMNKIQDISVVAFVSYLGIDGKYGTGEPFQVLNSTEAKVQSTTSVDENSVTNSGAVFPNPASGISRTDVEFSNEEFATVEIYNSIGEVVQKVKAGYFMPGKHSVYFNAENLPSGAYYVRIKSDSKVVTNSFVVSEK